MNRSVSVGVIALGVIGIGLWPVWYLSFGLGTVALLASWNSRQA